MTTGSRVLGESPVPIVTGSRHHGDPGAPDRRNWCQPADYRWSSYPCHGLGRDDAFLSPFPEWEELGRTEAERRRRWRAKVHRAKGRRADGGTRFVAQRPTVRYRRLDGKDGRAIEHRVSPSPQRSPPQTASVRLDQPTLLSNAPFGRALCCRLARRSDRRDLQGRDRQIDRTALRIRPEGDDDLLRARQARRGRQGHLQSALPARRCG